VVLSVSLGGRPMCEPSLSSFAMSALTTWRNPDGAEENWPAHGAKFPRVWSMVKCEFAYGLFGLTSVVEMIASGIFLGVTYPTALCANRPHHDAKRWFHGSLKSCKWAGYNMVHNFCDPNLPTTAQRVEIKRSQDNQRLYIAPWEFSLKDPLGDNTKED